MRLAGEPGGKECLCVRPVADSDREECVMDDRLTGDGASSHHVFIQQYSDQLRPTRPDE